MSITTKAATTQLSADYRMTDAQQRVDSKDSRAPIGLFDSGVGGLSVYIHLAEQLPAEHYVYYADTLHVPYGNRDSKEIEALTLTAVEWLYQQGCKLIVIACNSASAHALETTRRCYPQLPIVGLVPALKPAVLASKSGHVAVLATKATLEGALLNQVISDVATPKGTRVTKHFDSQLVPWVEAGMPEKSETAQRLRQQLQAFVAADVDYLVLGCTHYPFFKGFLFDEIRAQQLPLQVVDSGQAIAARVKSLLSEQQLLATNEHVEHMRYPLMFYASEYNGRLKNVVQRLVGMQTQVEYIA